MKKWIGQFALYGTLCATIPDAKDALVIQAKDFYNARTSSSVTVLEFVKLAVRNAVLNEQALDKQATVAASATATTGSYQSGVNAAQQQLQTDLNTIGTGW